MQGLVCSPIIFFAKHINVPKSRFEVNLYSNLDVVELITTYRSLGTIKLCALLLKIHLKVNTEGSAITEHLIWTISSNDAPKILVSVLEHIGKSGIKGERENLNLKIECDLTLISCTNNQIKIKIKKIRFI